jgi:hypothetical protein
VRPDAIAAEARRRSDETPSVEDADYHASFE